MKQVAAGTKNLRIDREREERGRERGGGKEGGGQRTYDSKGRAERKIMYTMHIHIFVPTL